MGPRASSVRAAASLAAIAAVYVACATAGNGDSTGSPGDDGSTAQPVDGSVDVAGDSSSGHDSSSSSSSGGDTGSGADSAREASGGGDSSSGGAEASMQDGSTDVALETTGMDAADSAAVDSASMEAAVDSGAPETGAFDGGSCTTSSQCNAPPAPVACYPAQGSCTGGTCVYDTNPGAAVCGSTCCNPIHGTCNPTCTLNCAGGYGHCSGDPSQGCETSTGTSTSDCGDCGRACSGANVSGLSCSGGVCSSTCSPGWGNCNEPAAPAADDGCESNLTTCVGTPCCGAGLCQGTHSNGLGGTYLDCSPLGVPGNAATYSSTMAQEATSSWANPGGVAQILTGGGCYESNGVTQDQCDASYTFSACAVWCFSGQLAGYVYENTAYDFAGNGSNCLCPSVVAGNSSTWN